MTAFDYAASASTADRLLNQFGRAVTHTKKNNGTLNPATGQKTGASADSTQSIVVVVLPIASTFKMDLIQADDSLKEDLVKGKARGIYIGPKKSNGDSLDFEPDVDHLVSIDGYQWRIAGVSPLKPAATVVMYRAAIRR